MKIFVSSTTTGLGQYRNYLVSCLVGPQFDVVEQNNLGSDRKTLDDLLRDRIGQCDVVFCLLGSRFGTQIPQDDPIVSPESYTQLEYRWAKEKGKDIFVFHATENCEGLQGLKPEDLNFEESQKLFVTKVLGECRNKYYSFKNEQELGRAVAEVIAHLVGDKQVASEDLPTGLSTILNELSALKSTPYANPDDVERCVAVMFLAIASLLERFPYICQTSNVENGPINDQRDVLIRAYKIFKSLDVSSECFIPELRQWFIDKRIEIENQLKTILHPTKDSSKLTREDKKTIVHQQIMLMEMVLHSLIFLKSYLLVKVEPVKEQIGFRIFRSLEANSVIPVDFDSELRNHEIEEGSVYLLSFKERQAVCLSSNLVPFVTLCGQAHNKYLCVDIRYAGLKGVIPLSMNFAWEYEPKVINRPIAKAWTGKLLTEKSWKDLSKRYKYDSQEEFFGCGLKRIGNPYHQGYLFSTYPAVRIQDKSKQMIAVQTSNEIFPEKVDKNQVEMRLREKGGLWSRLADQIPDLVTPLLPDSECSLGSSCPFIALPYYSDAVPLSQIHLEEQEIINVVRLAFNVCTKAGQLNIRLLTLHPRHILRLKNGTYRFLGFDTIASGGVDFSCDDGKKRIYRSEDWADLAPELQMHEICPTAKSDVFAIGALFQKLRGESPSARPIEKCESDMLVDMWREWRRNPIECFVFHCLAKDSNRRFQSIQQCAYFFERYVVGSVTKLEIDIPELVRLSETVSISRYPVTNYQYEQCEHENIHVRRRYMPVRFTGPFLPAVNVSLNDALRYCKWLNCYVPNGGKWRLPSEREWILAAAGCEKNCLFPWGSVSPTAQHANYDAFYFGTTVVGSFSSGVSLNGCEDMAGNVWEWCSDIPNGEIGQRIVKGGSYRSSFDMLSLKTRQSRLFGGRFDDVGFRIIHEK